MAKVFSTGYVDSPIEGASPQDLDLGQINFGADFRVKSLQAGKEVVLTNTTCPLDRPEKFRISYSEISNVYTGSGVDPALSAPTKRGVSLLVQLTEIISVTDSTDPEYRIDLPVSYHLVIKVPISEYISSDMVLTGIGRLLSGLYDTGSPSGTRLAALLRGSLVPSDI